MNAIKLIARMFINGQYQAKTQEVTGKLYYFMDLSVGIDCLLSKDVNDLLLVFCLPEVSKDVIRKCMQVDYL